ncbi:uncharacterized protein LOC116021067 [Ipomoea triloba]|uniref:uncharacterized protein LOC116021067 n=1 Tax=Ipomoea triloba TaxID=35885 RepID=UPI00125D8C3C|nr:uncharacterized protein LOC116021067 [Ipomoea triloba]XP_031117535.1 uncharacterized protein LOC116021067 [Ipomoea triloba]
MRMLTSTRSLIWEKQHLIRSESDELDVASSNLLLKALRREALEGVNLRHLHGCSPTKIALLPAVDLSMSYKLFTKCFLVYWNGWSSDSFNSVGLELWQTEKYMIGITGMLRMVLETSTLNPQTPRPLVEGRRRKCTLHQFQFNSVEEDDTDIKRINNTCAEEPVISIC